MCFGSLCLPVGSQYPTLAAIDFDAEPGHHVLQASTLGGPLRLDVWAGHLCERVNALPRQQLARILGSCCSTQPGLAVESMQQWHPLCTQDAQPVGQDGAIKPSKDYNGHSGRQAPSGKDLT